MSAGLSEYSGSLSDVISSCDQCNLTFEQSQTWEFANGVEAPIEGVVKNSIQQWFLNQQSIEGTKLQFWHFTDPAGMFNVEGGTVTFSTLQQRDCCELSNTYDGNCEVCGNGQGKSLTMIAGGGDGVYAVWKDDEELASNIFISFAPYKGEVPTMEDAKENHGECVPLYLGSITSDGALYVRENYQGQVSILVEPGEYDIIAWIGTRIRMHSIFALKDFSENTNMSEHLQAVSVSIHPSGTTNYKTMTNEILEPLSLTTNRVQAALWGSGHMNVLSHMQPATEFINYFSSQFIGYDKFLGRERAQGDFYYHLLTIGLEVLGEQARGDLELLENGTVDELMRSALMLIHVGRESAAIEQMTKARNKNSDLAGIYLDRWHSIETRDLFPTWGVMSGNLALTRADSFDVKDPAGALDYYLIAAERGRTEGLFGFVRNCLVSGNTNLALRFYGDAKSIAANQLRATLSNVEDATSKYFISFMFLADNTIGVCLVEHGDTEYALEMWQETIDCHSDEFSYAPAEAILYKLTLQQRLQQELALDSLRACSDEIRGMIESNLKNYLEGARQHGAEWTIKWLEDCLQVLGQV